METRIKSLLPEAQELLNLYLAYSQAIEKFQNEMNNIERSILSVRPWSKGDVVIDRRQHVVIDCIRYWSIQYDSHNQPQGIVYNALVAPLGRNGKVNAKKYRYLDLGEVHRVVGHLDV